MSSGLGTAWEVVIELDLLNLSEREKVGREKFTTFLTRFAGGEEPGEGGRVILMDVDPTSSQGLTITVVQPAVVSTGEPIPEAVEWGTASSMNNLLTISLSPSSGIMLQVPGEVNFNPTTWRVEHRHVPIAVQNAW